MKFSIQNFFSKCDQIRRKFIEEILNGKLHFLYSASFHVIKNWQIIIDELNTPKNN